MYSSLIPLCRTLLPKSTIQLLQEQFSLLFVGARFALLFLSLLLWYLCNLLINTQCSTRTEDVEASCLTSLKFSKKWQIFQLLFQRIDSYSMVAAPFELFLQVSEGLDFADRAGRAVVVTGIPFAMKMDPKVPFWLWIIFVKYGQISHDLKQSQAWWITSLKCACGWWIGVTGQTKKRIFGWAGPCTIYKTQGKTPYMWMSLWGMQCIISSDE